PRLVDHGYITTPNYAFLGTDGNWDIEGYGVSPDYEVENMSSINPDNSDPQLQKAVDVILEMLNNRQEQKPVVPEYPDRSN
ncbi:MAG TPA: hypothetical protein VLB82_00575, partial [Thermodesulfobacteriota bacterium]|nr:hypothetical protein [Thermodesulfobacteriota bacterium]